MHPRNKNINGYDFTALGSTSAHLKKFLSTDSTGKIRIDFANPAAVKALNRALLMHHYQIRGWEIPAGFLCPGVPGRADYIHTIADLLSISAKTPPENLQHIKALDIGTGANIIYPLLGFSEYQWQFVAADIDPEALANAEKILGNNPLHQAAIELRQQEVENNVFRGLLRHNETFALSLCNPPFHPHPEAARSANQRKLNQLQGTTRKDGKKNPTPVLNFGGQSRELWFNGGEKGFLEIMANQSAEIPERVLWFSSLVSKAENLPGLERQLQKLAVKDYRILPVDLGQKQSRITAWTFIPAKFHKRWLQQHSRQNQPENTKTA